MNFQELPHDVKPQRSPMRPMPRAKKSSSAASMRVKRPSFRQLPTIRSSRYPLRLPVDRATWNVDCIECWSRYMGASCRAESIAFMERAAAVGAPSAKRASPTGHSIRLRSALSPASRDWVEQTMFVVEGYGTRQAGVDAALNVLSACPRIGLLPNKTGHDRLDTGGRSDLGNSEPARRAPMKRPE
jgi:hypothetical protein